MLMLIGGDVVIKTLEGLYEVDSLQGFLELNIGILMKWIEVGAHSPSDSLV